jgi:hypothetical protein
MPQFSRLWQAMAKASKPASTASKRQYRLKWSYFAERSVLGVLVVGVAAAWSAAVVVLLPPAGCVICIAAGTGHVEQRKIGSEDFGDHFSPCHQPDAGGDGHTSLTQALASGEGGVRGHKVGEAGLLQGARSRMEAFRRTDVNNWGSSALIGGHAPNSLGQASWRPEVSPAGKIS